jgi:hypothetical protein
MAGREGFSESYFFLPNECGKNKTLMEPVANTWESVTGNVSELGCALSAGGKLYQHSGLSAEFEKM